MLWIPCHDCGVALAYLNWPFSKVQKPISLWREEISPKLAAAPDFVFAHLASLAAIQDKVMAQAQERRGLWDELS